MLSWYRKRTKQQGLRLFDTMVGPGPSPPPYPPNPAPIWGNLTGRKGTNVTVKNYKLTHNIADARLNVFKSYQKSFYFLFSTDTIVNFRTSFTIVCTWTCHTIRIPTIGLLSRKCWIYFSYHNGLGLLYSTINTFERRLDMDVKDFTFSYHISVVQAVRIYFILRARHLYIHIHIYCSVSDDL